jgi:hypothetical protein
VREQAGELEFDVTERAIMTFLDELYDDVTRRLRP